MICHVFLLLIVEARAIIAEPPDLFLTSLSRVLDEGPGVLDETSRVQYF
jgi:hypothetical protein